MAAVTAERILEHMGGTETKPYPVASGDTIYGGAAGIIVQEGYLENLTTSNVNEARIVLWIADKNDTYNNTPAATTSAGSISGSFVEGSITAGDRTVRQCWSDGFVRCTFTAIAQSDVGKTVYLQNNNTADETQIAGIKFGTLVAYISATDGWVELNKFYQKDGYVSIRGALVAATDTTGGGIMSVANPFGETAMIRNLVIDVTTDASTSVTGEFGVAANGTTSSSTLINACDLGAAAAVFTALTDGGVAGKGYRKWTTTQYVTGTASGAATALVGTYEIEAKIWE